MTRFALMVLCTVGLSACNQDFGLVGEYRTQQTLGGPIAGSGLVIDQFARYNHLHISTSRFRVTTVTTYNYGDGVVVESRRWLGYRYATNTDTTPNEIDLFDLSPDDLGLSAEPTAEDFQDFLDSQHEELGYSVTVLSGEASEAHLDFPEFIARSVSGNSLSDLYQEPHQSFGLYEQEDGVLRIHYGWSRPEDLSQGTFYFEL